MEGGRRFASQLLAWPGRWFRANWPATHTRLYWWSGGRLGHRFFALEQVLITTTGRRSGLPRTTPLAGIPLGDQLLLVASNWGQDTHPGWFHNLMECPDLHVQRGPRTVRMRARIATDDEREQLWPVAVRAFGGFERYAARTTRTIPVMICSPLDSPAEPT